jgi:hypothetical protein
MVRDMIGELAQELLRGCVDPVDIFDDQDERR